MVSSLPPKASNPCQGQVLLRLKDVWIHEKKVQCIWKLLVGSKVNTKRKKYDWKSMTERWEKDEGDFCSRGKKYCIGTSREKKEETHPYIRFDIAKEKQKKKTTKRIPWSCFSTVGMNPMRGKRIEISWIKMLLERCHWLSGCQISSFPTVSGLSGCLGLPTLPLLDLALHMNHFTRLWNTNFLAWNTSIV